MDAIGMSSASAVVKAGNASTPNVSSNRNAREAVQTNNTSSVDLAIERQDEKRREDRAREAQTSQRTLENVVSVSEDGDTVQVDPKTENVAAMANEGAVTQRQSAAESLREKEREDQRLRDEAANDQSQQITSFAGFTVSQIEQLYQQGRISRQDYERQLQIRQERTQSAMDSNSQNSENLARIDSANNRAQMDAQAIRSAFGDNSNDNAAASATERMTAMQRIQDNNQSRETARISEGRRQWDYQLQA